MYAPFADATTNGFIYYGEGDISIKEDGGVWKIFNGVDSAQIPSTKGLIFSTGNVYIDGAFNFTGCIIARKNIIIDGSAIITFNQAVVNKLMDANLNTMGLFKLLTYDIPTDATSIQRQRLSQKCIKITEWKEIQ
jgi:hypothetical protein